MKNKDFRRVYDHVRLPKSEVEKKQYERDMQNQMNAAEFLRNQPENFYISCTNLIGNTETVWAFGEGFTVNISLVDYTNNQPTYQIELRNPVFLSAPYVAQYTADSHDQTYENAVQFAKHQACALVAISRLHLFKLIESITTDEQTSSIHHHYMDVLENLDCT
jgi:hypothetical protein